MKTQITQGNWHIDKRETELEVNILSGDTRICAVKSFGTEFNDPTTEQADANAKLIASAPELLEALSLIISNYHQHIASKDVIECEALINKASLSSNK